MVISKEYWHTKRIHRSAWLITLIGILQNDPQLKGNSKAEYKNNNLEQTPKIILDYFNVEQYPSNYETFTAGYMQKL